jgi:hypothetical protein
VDVLKAQLSVKDKQLEAKDNQINKLMDAQERSDILLKGIQDRVRRLEAPDMPPTEQGRGEQKDNGLDINDDVQVDVQEGVHPDEQGDVKKGEVLEADFEEADQAAPQNVQTPEEGSVQSVSESGQAQEGDRGVSGQSTDPLPKKKQPKPQPKKKRRRFWPF